VTSGAEQAEAARAGHYPTPRQPWDTTHRPSTTSACLARYDRGMNAHARTLALAAIALSSGVAMAQIRKGDTLPEFAFIQGWNNAPKSYADLAGKVVILDFTQSW
jgi:hypothetical protein